MKNALTDATSTWWSSRPLVPPTKLLTVAFKFAGPPILSARRAGVSLVVQDRLSTCQNLALQQVISGITHESISVLLRYVYRDTE